MELKNKKVLVTGADGFIGSHLVEALVKRGADVRALSYYNSFNYRGWLEDIDCISDIEIISGDVRDPNFCRQLVKDTEVIFHLAALIAIPYSYVAPDSYVDTNVKGTLNICQAAMDSGTKKIIHTSTSEVYGTALSVPISETHPLQPQSPYSASKIGADMIAMSFYHAFNLPVTIARPFNTYGPRQSARAVIPTIISQMASGKNKISIGDVKPTRDFTYVTDTANAFIAMAGNENSVGEVINIGSDMEVSVEEIFLSVKKIMNSDAELIHEAERTRPEKSEVFRLRCDNSKLKKLTGFILGIPFNEGLKKTVEWFCNPENLKKYKTDIYNL